jgi:adenylate cyclase
MFFRKNIKITKLKIVIAFLVISLVTLFFVVQRNQRTIQKSYEPEFVPKNISKLEKNHLEDLLIKIAGKEAVDYLVSNYPKDPDGGEKIKAAVLFCDICHFSYISEKFPPKTIVHALNKYFKKIHEIASRHHGCINKFIGDAAMIIFASTGKGEKGSSEKSVLAALEIIKETKKIKLPNGTSLLTSVGINYGNVIAGLIGAPERYEYTVIGDVVNIASRLEGLSKQLHNALTISDGVYNNLTPKTKTLFRNLGTQCLKGKVHPVRTFGTEPLAYDEDVPDPKSMPQCSL